MTRPFPEIAPYPEVYDGIALGPNQRPPFPGSDEAVVVGCLCGHSSRDMFPPDQFIIRGDCPLHGVKEARSNVQMEMKGKP